MKQVLLTIYLIAGFCCPANAQNIKQVSLCFQKESIAFPFTRFTPIHPGGELGITFHEQIRDKSITNINVHLGGYHHKNIANALYVKGAYAFRPVIKSTISLDLVGNGGYMHTFYPGELYEMNHKDGEFEKITQTGRPHLLAGAGIGFTYLKNKEWQPFIHQDLCIETPFANGIPVMIHSFLKVGINYSFKP